MLFPQSCSPDGSCKCRSTPPPPQHTHKLPKQGCGAQSVIKRKYPVLSQCGVIDFPHQELSPYGNMSFNTSNLSLIIWLGSGADIHYYYRNRLLQEQMLHYHLLPLSFLISPLHFDPLSPPPPPCAVQHEILHHKDQISHQSKSNFKLEKDLRFLDSKIALLISHKITVEVSYQLTLLVKWGLVNFLLLAGTREQSF